MAPTKKDNTQALPTKEQGLFRLLVKQYESKLYKKGLKTADAILKKCPENGETLAMKGLLYNCLGKKEEAYDFVKRGVKANLRSHVCWHVYGLLYRSDMEYDEAIKCYKSSLRMEKDNLTVLGDLAQLQIQMRDLPGFLESRQRLLELKPTDRRNWISLALAHHLLGNYEVASTVLESYESTLDDSIINAEPYEHSEILLYKVSILKEGGKYEEALQALAAAEKAGHITDTIGAMETRAEIYCNLERFEEAHELYSKLLSINPENHGYHDQMIRIWTHLEGSLDSADINEKYTILREKYPDSIACKRIPLDVLKGEDFENGLKDFVEPYVVKGIPSLFSALKPFYSDPEKIHLVHRVLEERLQNASEEEKVWINVCLAMHHLEIGDIENALKSIELSLEIKSDIVEALSAKGQVLEAAGDLEAAAAVFDEARRLDLSDRYLNCQAATALFKAGRWEYAEKVAHLFTKEGDSVNNFYDMQATWYEIASGNSYLQSKQFGKALKRFRKVDEHFADFMEDQFDFHRYCVRKQTMRAYVDMLRMLDNLYLNDIFAQAVLASCKIYLEIYVNPPKTKEQVLEERLVSMAPEEAKRERQRIRKEEARKEKAKAAEEEANKHKESNKRVDDDPDGEKLLHVEYPLEEASKLLKKLTYGNPKLLEGQIMSFKVHLCRGKLFLALNHLLRAIRLTGQENPHVHECIIDLQVKLNSEEVICTLDQYGPQAEITKEVLISEFNTLTKGHSAEEYHATWAAEHANKSMEHKLMAMKLHCKLNMTSVTEAIQTFVQDFRDTMLPKASHEQSVNMLHWMTERLGDEDNEVVKAYKSICATKFKWSRVFEGPLCAAMPSFEVST